MAMGMAMSVVLMSVVLGVNVIHGWMLFYNITGVHALGAGRPSRGADRPSFARISPSSEGAGEPRRGAGRPSREGAGKTGCALHPRSRVQSVERNAHEHTGSAEAIRPSLRNGFTAYFALSPVSRALLPPSLRGSLRKAWRQRRAPERHVFTVRSSHARQSQLSRPPHPTARS
jgi:hypothetical protein